MNRRVVADWWFAAVVIPIKRFELDGECRVIYPQTDSIQVLQPAVHSQPDPRRVVATKTLPISLASPYFPRWLFDTGGIKEGVSYISLFRAPSDKASGG